MQEDEVILEIPEVPESQEDGAEWQPPVLKKAELSEKKQLQSCADIFFMQYIICILILTALFAIRIYDESIFQNTVNLFENYSHAPSEIWVEELINWLKNLWS